MATMKELEAQLVELAARVKHIEQYAGVPSLPQAEADEAARDAEILSRYPSNRAEAVAFDAAKARQDERDAATDDADDDVPQRQG